MALQQGHTAVQLKQQPGASLFSFEVGNLRAMEEAVITFSYVRLLNSVAGALEFEHQATWVPPYVGSTVPRQRGPMTEAGRLTGSAPDLATTAAENPDNLAFAQKVSYKLSYCIKLHSSRGFRSVDSPSPVSVVEDGPSLRTVTLAESGENVQIRRHPQSRA